MTDSTPKETLDVFYRADTDDGSVAAFFPTMPFEDNGNYITAYARVGQHSAGSWEYVAEQTRPATPDEYAELHAELTRIYEECELIPDNRIPDIIFTGSDFEFHKDDCPTPLNLDLLDCFTPGADATESVNYVLETHYVVGDDSTMRDYLRGYGAWEDSELQDRRTNMQRLIWLTGCAFAEDRPAYFCTY